MDAGDAKLVQILLGPKYCQLWQYWAIHAMISYNMLAIERTANCKLPLSIITQQKKLLEEQKELLDKQGKFLDGKENQSAVGILQTKELLKNLFDITCNEAKEYRKKIAETNKIIYGIHHLFHVPDEARHIQYYTASNHEQIAGGDQSQAIVIRDEAKSDFSYETAFGCVSSALRSIDKVVKTRVVYECDLLINATEEAIDKEVCQDVGKVTWFLHYLDKADYWLNGNNGRILDEAVENIPENIPLPAPGRVAFLNTVNPRSITRGTIIGLRYILENTIGFFQKKYDDINNADCIKNKI
ncbi:hypothetical protein, partial [Wolbachia endosymbiont of Pentidionis agamae]|uniref:hypothetical protein n=1 Tax=Wolbachia endosymbiont of Pentidionis agamae TaxID=3110435 RepID=UPI002FD2296E